VTGSLTGNVTGNVSGTAANVTGIVLGANGGTGVANTGKTITLGGNLTTTGAHTTELITTGNTSVTLPTSGTLLTTTGNGSGLTGITGAQISGNISGNAANVTGVIAISNGGTGQTTQQAAMNSLAGATTSGRYLRGDGTNVTMSLLQASDLNGVVSIANGGTNNNTLAVTNGGVVYADGTRLQTSVSGSAGQILRSTGAGAPVWSTPTFPNTANNGRLMIGNGTNWIETSAAFPASTTANQILYSSAANTVTGLATANNGVLITSGAGVPSISSTLPSAVQGNITSVGTIGTGTWQGTVISPAYGGTGVNNGTRTINLGGNFTTSGAFSTTLTVIGNTNVTLPTSGTLATSTGNLSQFAATTSAQLAGVISDETGTGSLVFSSSPVLTTPNIGNASGTSLTLTSDLTAKHIAGAAGTPTVAWGPGASGTPTATNISGKDIGGYIEFTTGGAAPAANSIIATITFNTAFSAAPSTIVLSAGTSASGLDLDRVFISTITTTSFQIRTTSTAINAGSHKFYFMVIQ
jgi:hypothetical protein